MAYVKSSIPRPGDGAGCAATRKSQIILVDVEDVASEPTREVGNCVVTGDLTLTKGGRFREDWPFLSEPDCPTELKALAADMITSWHNYVNAHEDLFKCTTPEECFEAAEKTVRNFYQNSVSRTEFQYYKEHHRILGKHPIFALTKKLDNLRRMPITELIRKRRNVQDSIWRAEREIKKGDRPDLKVSREERLSRLKMTLDEINRMIKEYEGTDYRTSR